MNTTPADNFAAARAGGLEAQVRLLIDRAEIADVVTRFAQSTDTRDYVMYRTCFTDEIEMDFPHTVGGGPTRHPADEWVDMSQQIFSRLDGLEHLLITENIVIDGDTAESYVILHCRHRKETQHGDPNQIMIGYYVFTFARTTEGWKISGGRQRLRWNEGNWFVYTKSAEVFGPRPQDAQPLESAPSR